MQTIVRWTIAGVLLGVLVGCGGGSSSPVAAIAVPQASAPTAPASPSIRTAVIVDVTDDTGRAVEGAQVRVRNVTLPTDARGVVEFPEQDVPADWRWISVFVPDSRLYSAAQDVPLTAGQTRASFRLYRRRTVAVLDARTVQRSSDGDRIGVAVDVAVFTPEGAVETPAAAGFRVSSIDCGWGPADCATGPDGRSIAGGGNFSGPALGAVTVASLAGDAGAPVVAGVLVDVAAAEYWDPEGRRFGALRTYFRNAGSASVALGTLGAAGATSVPPAGFAVDGTRFDAVLNALAGTRGPSRLDAPAIYSTISGMADAAAAAAAPAGSRRHVVAVVSSAFYGADDPCAAGLDCRRSLEGAIARARARGIRVVTLGTSDHLADLAVRTAGISVDVGSQHQFDGAVRALPSLLGGTAPRQRLMFDLGAGRDTFVAGGTVYAVLVIEVAPSQHEQVTLAIPIPAT